MLIMSNVFDVFSVYIWKYVVYHKMKFENALVYKINIIFYVHFAYNQSLIISIPN